MKALITSRKTYPVIVCLLAYLIASSQIASAKRDVILLDNKGISESILEQSGVNLANARLVTKTTKQDIQDYCENWQLKTCNDSDHQVDLSKAPETYLADCIAHTVTLPWKRINDSTISHKETSTFAYSGAYLDSEGDVSQKWVDVKKYEVVNSSGVSEYLPIQVIYSALCPTASSQATKEEEELGQRLLAQKSQISFDDFWLDKASMVNNKVQLTGFGTYSNDLLFLTKKFGATNMISVKVENLSRENRRYLLGACSPYCNVTTVVGTVNMDMFGNISIDAQQIEATKFNF